MYPSELKDQKLMLNPGNNDDVYRSMVLSQDERARQAFHSNILKIIGQGAGKAPPNPSGTEKQQHEQQLELLAANQRPTTEPSKLAASKELAEYLTDKTIHLVANPNDDIDDTFVDNPALKSSAFNYLAFDTKMSMHAAGTTAMSTGNSTIMPLARTISPAPQPSPVHNNDTPIPYRNEPATAYNDTPIPYRKELGTAYDNDEDAEETLCNTFSMTPTTAGGASCSTPNFSTTLMTTDNCGGDCMGNSAEYRETIKRSRTSSLMFKRKYKPLRDTFEEDSELKVKPPKMLDISVADKPEAEGTNMFESRIDKILKIMNTAESDFSQHKIRVTNAAKEQDASNGFHQSTAADGHNYSYYALFFMITSNLIGLGLSLLFQILLFVKINADGFLLRCWEHWHKVGIRSAVNGKEHSLWKFFVLMPMLVIVCTMYGCIWACFSINKFLLTAVPDRVAHSINFNIQIIRN